MRHETVMGHERRQTKEEQECYVGNGQLSCYPEPGSRFTQGVYGRFIWNRNFPEFTNNGGYVDVYLFQEDSDKLVETWKHIDNNQGRIAFLPQDSWWQDRQQARDFNGTDISWPYYFLITYAGKGLNGKPNRQPTWFATQTALPTVVAAARSSSSSAAASSLSSAAVASSLSAALASATRTVSNLATAAPTPTPLSSSWVSSDALAQSSFAASLTAALVSSLNGQNATGTETMQGTATMTLSDGQVITASATAQANGALYGDDDDRNSGLPHYAIALIVIFGLMSLIALLVGVYFCLAATGRKRRHTQRESYDNASSTPMIGDRGYTPVGPVSGERPEMAESRSMPDGGADAVVAASSQDDDDQRRAHEEALTSSEVWRIADAFRSVLRRPQFGVSSRTNSIFGMPAPHSDSTHDEPRSPTGDTNGQADALLRAELAGEGRELRSVGERKQPQLHA